MANIKVIARKAGVSISTVSRVMNGTKPVSADLTKRVHDAVEQMNYKPNSIARSLILNKTNLIGVVVPDVANSFQAQLLAGIEEYAAQSDYGVIICNVYRDRAKPQKYFNILIERHVDGIILLHEASPEKIFSVQEKSSTPLVFASVQVEGARIPFVGIDEVQAAADAVTYLAEKGHRKIAMIYGEGTALGVLRKQGYLQALDHQQLQAFDSYMVQCSCTVAQGYQAMEQLLALAEPPTAVFCVSDELAVGALDCALDQGVNVPEELSLMGFDDIDLSQVVRPKLTTVHQPIREIGEEAAKLMIALIEGNASGHSTLILPHEIRERETVAALENPSGEVVDSDH